MLGVISVVIVIVVGVDLGVHDKFLEDFVFYMQGLHAPCPLVKTFVEGLFYTYAFVFDFLFGLPLWMKCCLAWTDL
jgi:hypothetical protein